MNRKFVFFGTLILNLLLVSPVFADKGTYNGYYGIIDLAMMDEKQYDSERDQTVIGYIMPQEVFRSLSDCKSALIGKYAGTVWEIEKTKNPFRDGELRLHQYESRYNPNTNRMEKRIKSVRFCVNLVGKK